MIIQKSKQKQIYKIILCINIYKIKQLNNRFIYNYTLSKSNAQYSICNTGANNSTVLFAILAT